MRTKGPRADKVAVVAELQEVVAAAKGVVITEYRGLTVAEITALRTKLRPTGGRYHVVKNSLLKRAYGDGLTAEMEALLTGPTAIAVALEDPVATAKGVLDFLRELRKPEIVVTGGFLEGKVLDAAGVTALSKIPPKPVVLGLTLGAIQAPLTSLAGTMNGVLGEFARTLQALADQKQAA